MNTGLSDIVVRCYRDESIDKAEDISIVWKICEL